MAVSLPSYEGPLLSLTGGVDCSFVLSGAVGGVVYLVLFPKAAPRPADTDGLGTKIGATPSSPR